jgi:phage/plasmid-associated DNA primase
LPLTYDLSQAFWSRWIILEFPYTFVTEKELKEIPENEKSKYKIKDPNIIEKITTKDELSGLLNLALNGLKRLMENNCFSYSKNTEEVKRLWLRKSSSFNAFLMDCTELNEEETTLKSELRKAYSRYCRKHKLRGASDKVIKGVLSEMGVGDERESFDGVQKAVWVGIKLREEEDLSKCVSKENSKGSEDSNGFSTYPNNSNSYIGSKTISNLTKLTNFKENELKYSNIINISNHNLFSGKCKLCREIRSDLDSGGICLDCLSKKFHGIR